MSWFCSTTIFFAALLLVAVSCVTPAADESATAPTSRADKVAHAVVDALAGGDFKAAGRDFDEAMSSALPEPTLRSTWQTIIDGAGKFLECGQPRAEKKAKLEVVTIPCTFEHGPLEIHVSVDTQGRVTGLFFSEPKTAAQTWVPPAYADSKRFRAHEVTIGTGEWALPGTVTIPLGAGPFPGVVLVHGSGPNDRDESSGPNKPFRDLAWGLASRGIAVLQYDKRTFAHRSKMSAMRNTITVDTEVVDDALAALAALRKTSGVDPRRVFVAGHSLGGSMAPRIVQRDESVAGYVSMSGSVRPLEDIVADQIEYLMRLRGAPSTEVEKERKKLQEQAARIKDPALTTDMPADAFPLGIPASWWLSVRGYDPAATAAALARPILVLQGGRDYQVTLKEYELWKKALEKKPFASFHVFPTLNHLLIAGEGSPGPTEYERPGHVSEELVNVIARWILGKTGK